MAEHDGSHSAQPGMTDRERLAAQFEEHRSRLRARYDRRVDQTGDSDSAQ